MNVTVLFAIANITQGQLNGTTGTDLDGETYYKFFGIPYAQPPVGSLRFKAPEAPDSWDGVRDATTEASACLASSRASKAVLVGSEDCLYLNVFTKQLPESGLELKPVMVFIPGGAFTLGGASDSLYGAQYFMTEDIVLVTLNYRLGILGFLSSDNHELDVPGNAGLKDQVYALKWVQENIESFNGDPNNVTIFGISAGGASVSFHTLSPTAKGLFHKAIAQSGSALDPWVWGSKNNAIQVAEILGQNVSSEKEALEILMEATGEEVVYASLQIPDEVTNPSKKRPFSPVIERPNPTAFLTESPVKLLATGNYNQVPLIQGVVSNEGTLYDYPLMGGFDILGSEVPWSLRYKNGTRLYSNVAERVDNFYFDDGVDTNSTYEFIGDVNMGYGVVEKTRLVVSTSSEPVYLYVFSLENSLSNIVKIVYGINADVEGVAHGGDQMVLFHTSLVQLLGIELTEELTTSIKQLVKMWADFARTGRPHPQWEPVTNPYVLNYFDINDNYRLNVNPFASRVAFWERIFWMPPFY